MSLWPMRMIHRWDKQDHPSIIQSKIDTKLNKKVKAKLKRQFKKIPKRETLSPFLQMSGHEHGMGWDGINYQVLVSHTLMLNYTLQKL